MQITLIRHLPTEWNQKNLLQGRRNIDLSDVSRELDGIERNKQLLQENAPYDLVLASSLRRTCRTAKLHGYEPEVEKLLDELDFGIYEGRPKKELQDYFGEQWVEEPETIVLGESLLAFQGRIISFLEKYQTYTNILVFGHGAWIRAFLSYVENDNITNMNKRKVDNNELIIVNIPKRISTS